MEPETANELMPQTEKIVPRNFFSRLGGVYTSPRATFREIGRSPGVVIPIIAFVILSVLVGYLVAQRVDVRELAVQQIERLGESGRIPPEQLELLKQRAASGSRYGNLASGPIAGFLMVLVVGGIAKLVSVFLNAGNRFKAILVVTLYATIAVTLVQRALYVLMLYVKNPAEIDAAALNSLLASNLGSWISGILGESALPKYAMALAGYVDVFAIWKIALLAIGYSAISAKLKAGTAAAWITGFYVIMALIGAAIGSLFGMTG